jgi:glutathione S-transferase
VHDGHAITDSSVINEYLDDVFPEVPLRPKNAVALAHMRAWRQYIDEVPTEAIRYPSFNAHFVRITASMSDEQFAAHVSRMPLRKHFYQRMGRTGFPKSEVDAALDRLRQTAERMQAALGKTEWLADDQYTLADISIVPTIVRMEDLGLSHLWADLPRVKEWYARVQQRPSFSATYSAPSRMLTEAC